MAIIHGNINAGGGSNKPLSEQTYEKILTQEVQFGLVEGQEYYLKTSGITLPATENPNGFGTNIYSYTDPETSRSVPTLYYTTLSNDEVAILWYDGSAGLSAGAYYRANYGWVYGTDETTSLTDEDLAKLHFTFHRMGLYQEDALRSILEGNIPEDKLVTVDSEKVTLGEKVEDLKNWDYEQAGFILKADPDWDFLIDNWNNFINGLFQTQVHIYGGFVDESINMYRFTSDGEDYYYLQYYNDVEDKSYYLYNDKPADTPYPLGVWWTYEDEIDYNIIELENGPQFTPDITKIYNRFAFNAIYGKNAISLDEKLNSIQELANGILKDKIYDETTETNGLVDGETYNFKSDMEFSATYSDLDNLQPDDFIYDDGTKDIQFVIETDFLSRTFAYLVYHVNNEQTSYYYTVAQLGDETEFINEWADETVPSIQVDLSGIINENIFTKMLDVEISTVTVQKTLEQKLSEFKTWIYDYKESSSSQLEDKVYNVKMNNINIDFTNASNNQQIALGSDGTELCYFTFYNNGNSVLALNFYNNSANIDLYYHPSFNCWKEGNGTNYNGEQLTFTVNTSNVTDETALREIIEIEAGGEETPITLEERIETPLKDWTYEGPGDNSGSGETAIKPIFDSLPIILDNKQTFLDSELVLDTYHNELLYQTQSNGIRWSFSPETSVMIIGYMIPDFENDAITVFENTITLTGANTGISEWDFHVEPMLPEGNEMYEVTPITSQDELPVFENFDPSLAESGYSDVVALLVGEVSSSGSSSNAVTLGEKIADLKNWAYENTPESDKFLTTPNWTDILTYISGDLIALSTYTVYEKQNENAPWDYIEVAYDSSNDDLGVNAMFNGNMYKCFNYQYTESTSGDECAADTWYAVTVSYGPGQNPGEPGPAVYSYTELTDLPNLTIDSTAIEISDLFDAIVVHTDAVNLTLDQKIESIGGFSGDYNDLSNKPAYTISNVVTDNSEVLGIQVYNATNNVLYNVMSANTLGTASTCDTGTGAGNIPILDSNGKLNDSVLPALAISDTFVVNSQAAMLALTAQVGDVAVRTDLNKSYILKTAGASTLANWQELLTPTDAVQSVNGHTGSVTLTQADLNIIYSSTQPSNPVTGTIWIKPAA